MVFCLKVAERYIIENKSPVILLEMKDAHNMHARTTLYTSTIMALVILVIQR